MDDLLCEFLTETSESLDVVDVELVKFEQEPNNARILDNIFRLVHTIKGTCGFLGLPRLEALAHAAETLMGRFRDGARVTPEAVSLVLLSIDRIKVILGELERTEAEPEGSDADIIAQLEEMATRAESAIDEPEALPVPEIAAAPPVEAEDPPMPSQALERPLRVGEVSLDELERAFRETEVEIEFAAPSLPAVAVEPVAEPEAVVKIEPLKAVETAQPAQPVRPPEASKPQRKPAGDEEDGVREISVASQSIRVGVETLEHLMTMVSELVLTRNQLLEIVRATRNRSSRPRCSGSRTSRPSCRKA